MKPGEMIRSARQDRSLSLRDLAEKFGVSHTFIREMECGVRSAPSRLWAPLCAELGLNLLDLVRATVAEGRLSIDASGCPVELREALAVALAGCVAQPGESR